jgi:predicted nucleic acid-binding protein
VVDTCLVLDVLEGDPEFGPASATLLQQKLADGLVACPVTVIELAPAFAGDWRRLEYFLREVGVRTSVSWEHADTASAFQAWQRYVQRRRAGGCSRRPVADVMIGAFSLRFQGLLTRNPDDFRPNFPALVIEVPGPLRRTGRPSRPGDG